jgi:hypothetical protein
MKLLLRGWSKYVLDHTLIDDDISNVKASEEEASPGGDRLEIVSPETTVSGDLRIVAKAKNLRLTGDFEVTVRLTKDEVANLARIAFGKDPFADVVDALSREER